VPTLSLPMALLLQHVTHWAIGAWWILLSEEALRAFMTCWDGRQGLTSLSSSCRNCLVLFPLCQINLITCPPYLCLPFSSRGCYLA
jgi:hypothetical protein